MSDGVVLWRVLAQRVLGLVTLPVFAGHMDGGEMVKLMTWAQRIVTFRGDAASYVAGIAPVFKLH